MSSNIDFDPLVDLPGPFEETVPGIDFTPLQRAGIRRFAYMFLALLGFWLLLMGIIDVQRLLAGIIVAALVTTFWLRRVPVEPDERSALSLLLRPSFLRYIALMAWEILRANWAVARIVLDPKMPISPTFVHVKTRLKHDLTRPSAEAVRSWPVEQRVEELERGLCALGSRFGLELLRGEQSWTRSCAHDSRPLNPVRSAPPRRRPTNARR